MQKSILSILLITVSILTNAQKKNISYNQVFKDAPTNIFKQLPTVTKWIDDDNYLLQQKDETGNTTTTSVVNIKTNVAVPYVEPTPKTKKDFSIPKNAKNFTFSPNESLGAYTLYNNLYVINIASQKTTQLTFDGNDSILNGYASWVYFEEILARASKYKAFWWSPDNKRIAFMRFDDSKVPVFPLYVATGQHGYLENQRYPKVGDENPKVKIGLVNIDNSKITWANFNEQEDQYFGTPLFTPNNQLWVQWMNRKQNNLKLYNIDFNTGKKTEIYNEQQATWVTFYGDNPFTFLKDGKSFILKTDKPDWSHFYLHNSNGNLINQITTGEFSVGNIIKLDEQNKTIYFTARKENSARWDFYMATLDGKKMQRLSFGDYSFTNINLSPNNKYFTATYSNTYTPSAIGLIDVNGKLIKEIANSKGVAFNDYDLPNKQFLRVKSEDNLFDLPLTITFPTTFDVNKKYPVLVSVYGGPNAGRVYDTWSMPNTDIWWAQENLILVSIDNRSSGHFGKKGMNYIFRQLGKYEIEDFMAVGKWLKQQPWMDTSKLCITGGSFGGYMTAMALTYGADVFNYGIANSSVTDWQLYDSHYTERYMNTQKDNLEGYKQTSVLEYANKYKGLLRIVHGTSDDNVHPQNSIQLINRLQDLKKNFELMLYPGERHGITGAKRIHNNMAAYKFYYENLLNKKMPNDFLK